MRKIQESREMLPRIVQNIRDMQLDQGKKLFFFCTAVLSLYFMYQQVMKMSTIKMEDQGNQFSVHMEVENPWLGIEAAPVPLPMKEDMIPERLANVIRKNQVQVTLGEERANGLFIKSNLMIVPKHLVPTSANFNFASVYSSTNNHGSNITKSLNKEDVYMLPDCDLALLWVSAGGPRRDLTSSFPKSRLSATTTTQSIYNDGDEIIENNHRISSYRQIDTGRAKFRGALIRYPSSTFAGQCGTTHISQCSASSILGFHAAGINGSPEGALTSTTYSDVMEGIKTLESRSHVLPPLGPGVMMTQAYGIDFTPSSHIAANSPLRYQEKAQVTCYGTLPNAAVRPKSSVVTSPISKVVEDVTGVPNEHGPPANCRPRENGGIPSWEPYQKYITGVGSAYQEFPSDVMQWAIEDYLTGFDDMFKTPFGQDLLSQVRVLDDVETTSGVNGMKFVDSMKPNTSMGYPVNKKKEEYMSELGEEHPSCSLPRIMDDETLRLAQRARTLWLSGQRSNEIFKTCTKDEPTKLTKAKVRCFQAAPVSLQMNIRKYFLTMCHLLSMSSKTSECAVGINAQGRGWHEINEHMIRFGSDRVVAGDFKAYDQHMSAGMVMASYKVFQHIGKAAGYSDEDLKIMQGCATEVAYPLMSLNGELIQLFGSNPSGQNLTVYTNSIVNSLYHRCVFRILYPNYEGKFSDASSLMSYGDDVKMSVNPAFPLFNHTKIQEVFNSFGIEYTMAEKEADSVPYIRHEDADFLKRKSRWEPSYSYMTEDGTRQNGLWLAMLDESSIYKSLHSNLASKTQSSEEVARQCLAGALREWFFYGEEHFNRKFNQMKDVVSRMGWEHSMPENFWDTYEVREAQWLLNNEVDKNFESQTWVSQSAFIRNVKAFTFKSGNQLILPIGIHDTQSSFADPFEEELICTKPAALRILCQEYKLSAYVGDILLAYGSIASPILICLELKSQKTGAAYRQASRLSRFAESWFMVHDTRVQMNPVEVYSVGISPHAFVTDIDDPVLFNIIEEWYLAFAKECHNGDTLPANA
jgi:hypothetical protein